MFNKGQKSVNNFNMNMKKIIKKRFVYGFALWSGLPAWLHEHKFSTTMPAILTALRADKTQ